MPFLQNADASIYYEDVGTGYPVLLFAPGAMNACIPKWHALPGSLDPYMGLGKEFRLIGFDQRHAGQSKAPIKVTDGWGPRAGDAVALIRHLGLTSFAIEACCIGPCDALKALELLGDDISRVTAFVNLNPAGIDGPNRGRFMAMFYKWAEELPAEMRSGPALNDPVLASFAENMFGGDFVFSVSRDFVRGLQMPMLVAPGTDMAHPEALGREVAALVPNAELYMGWAANPEDCAKRVFTFLKDHTAG